jgi:3-oxoacyl-[acyl-carrier-protein] synthase III
MKAVYLDSLAFAVGDTHETLEEAARARRLLSSVAALRDAGFEEHHVCRAETTAYDLARRAVQSIAGELGEIDAILYATCLAPSANLGSDAAFRATRDVKHLMDFPASHLQADFDLTRATVIGIHQQACTGLLGGIRVARALVAAEAEAHRVLCLTADRFPAGATYEQAYNLVSDGAAACVVSDTPGRFRIVASHAITNGALALASDDETVGSYFTYSHRLIRETLWKARMTIGDVSWIVPQNTNVRASRILARLIGADDGRFYFPSIARVGHMISGDNIVNLKQLVEDGRLRAGQRVLSFMAGFGLNWQCIVLEVCE